MELQVQEIMDIIPNRYPILFIDRVQEMVPDESLVAIKNVTANEAFFANQPTMMMPSTLIIETMAQAASILILYSPKFAHKTAYMTGVNQADFHQLVKPGDVLHMTVKFGTIRENMGTVKVEVTVDGQLTTEAELMFVVADQQ